MAALASGAPEIDQSMKELLSQPGVEAYLVFNDTGVPIRWSASGFGTTSSSPIPPEVIHFSALISSLASKSQAAVKRLMRDDVTDDGVLRYLRLRTTSNEVIVAPGEGCTLVVIQDPSPYKKPKTESKLAE